MSLVKKLWSRWQAFARVLAWLTAPIRIAIGFTVMTLIYFLVIPLWTVFMVWGDPLRTRLDREATTYFEPTATTDTTLESLSHAS